MGGFEGRRSALDHAFRVAEAQAGMPDLLLGFSLERPRQPWEDSAESDLNGTRVAFTYTTASLASDKPLL